MQTAYDDILIIQTAFIGDVLLSIPLLKKTRRLWPQARISILVREGLGDFAKRSGLVDHVYEVDKKDSASWKKTSSELRARSWGLVLSPHQSPRTLLLVRSLRAQRKVGYKSFLAPFIFDQTIARPMALPEALRQLALLASDDPSLPKVFSAYLERAQDEKLAAVPVGSEMSLAHFIEARAQWRSSREALTLSARVQDLSAHIDKSKRLALLAPGSVWNTKRWTSEGYAETARELLREGWQVWLTGAPDERALCEAVAQAAPGTQVVAGRLSIWESIELMTLADLVIANDSGAMHMASVAAAPTVSVFGPTVLMQGYRPWQTNARVVETELPCRPCGKHGAEKCPIGTHACMKNISAADVLTAARTLKI